MIWVVELFIPKSIDKDIYIWYIIFSKQNVKFGLLNIIKGGNFMKKVLDDLYFGEIQPNIRTYDKNSMLKRALQTVDENQGMLLKLLNGEEKRIFLDLVNAQSEVDGNSAYENFVFGFKLGARIMVETLVEI